jgi:hypothetical protein
MEKLGGEGLSDIVQLTHGAAEYFVFTYPSLQHVRCPPHPLVKIRSGLAREQETKLRTDDLIRKIFRFCEFR